MKNSRKAERTLHRVRRGARQIPVCIKTDRTTTFILKLDISEVATRHNTHLISRDTRTNSVLDTDSKCVTYYYGGITTFKNLCVKIIVYFQMSSVTVSYFLVS